MPGEEGRTPAAAAAAAAAEPAPSFFLRRGGESAVEYASRIFGCVFGTQIEAVRCVEDLWRSRPPPQPLDLKQILPAGADGSSAAGSDAAVPSGAEAAAADGAVAAAGGEAAQAANGVGASGSRDGGGSACTPLGLRDTHAVWDLEQSARVFLEAVRQYHELRGEELGTAQVMDGARGGVVNRQSLLPQFPLPSTGDDLCCAAGVGGGVGKQ